MLRRRRGMPSCACCLQKGRLAHQGVGHARRRFRSGRAGGGAGVLGAGQRGGAQRGRGHLNAVGHGQAHAVGNGHSRQGVGRVGGQAVHGALDGGALLNHAGAAADGAQRDLVHVHRAASGGRVEGDVRGGGAGGHRLHNAGRPAPGAAWRAISVPHQQQGVGSVACSNMHQGNTLWQQKAAG